MDVGRQERFRSLYLWARPRILAYALRRARSAQDAADVVAEIFAIVWRRLEDVPDGEEALPWLSRALLLRATVARRSRDGRETAGGPKTARRSFPVAGIYVPVTDPRP